MILIGLPLIALFAISLGGYLSSEILKCLYNKRAIGTVASYKYTAIVSAACALSLVLLSGFAFPFSYFSVLLGLLFGIAVMGHICASSVAIQVGPWSYTSVMVSLAIVIPAFSGAVIWNEPLSWLDFVGVAFMVACLILSVKKDEENKKANIKWLLLCILAMSCMAGIGLLQKTHQSSAHKAEVTVFLITAFLFSAVCASVLYFIGKRKAVKTEAASNETVGKPLGRKVYFLMAGAGLATALNHSINLYLSGALNSVVFFPIMCGCELIGVTLASLLLFKERLSHRQWIGFACGAVAVLLLCI